MRVRNAGIDFLSADTILMSAHGKPERRILERECQVSASFDSASVSAVVRKRAWGEHGLKERPLSAHKVCYNWQEFGARNLHPCGGAKHRYTIVFELFSPRRTWKTFEPTENGIKHSCTDQLAQIAGNNATLVLKLRWTEKRSEALIVNLQRW